MDLFIQIKNGQPYEHPIMDWNFKDAFPNIDVNNLPPEFARFERVPCDIPVGTYEVPYCTYQWVGNVVKDVWQTRPMTDEERAEKDAQLAEQAAFEAQQQAIQQQFENLDTTSGSAPDVIV